MYVSSGIPWSKLTVLLQRRNNITIFLCGLRKNQHSFWFIYIDFTLLVFYLEFYGELSFITVIRYSMATMAFFPCQISRILDYEHFSFASVVFLLHSLHVYGSLSHFLFGNGWVPYNFFEKRWLPDDVREPVKFLLSITVFSWFVLLNSSFLIQLSTFVIFLIYPVNQRVHVT